MRLEGRWEGALEGSVEAAPGAAAISSSLHVYADFVPSSKWLQLFAGLFIMVFSGLLGSYHHGTDHRSSDSRDWIRAAPPLDHHSDFIWILMFSWWNWWFIFVQLLLVMMAGLGGRLRWLHILSADTNGGISAHFVPRSDLIKASASICAGG